MNYLYAKAGAVWNWLSDQNDVLLNMGSYQLLWDISFFDWNCLHIRAYMHVLV